MLTLLITIVIGIATYAAANNGEWGSVAIGVLIILGAWFMKMVALMDDKAWLHRTEYWAMSGKDRAKARSRWEREAREEEERDRAKRAESARRLRERREANAERIADKAAAKARHGQSHEERMKELLEKQRAYKRRAYGEREYRILTFVCHYCGREVNVSEGATGYGSDGLLWYVCPNCGRENETKLGMRA